jgi:hypothetical protein
VAPGWGIRPQSIEAAASKAVLSPAGVFPDWASGWRLVTYPVAEIKAKPSLLQASCPTYDSRSGQTRAAPSNASKGKKRRANPGQPRSQDCRFLIHRLPLMRRSTIDLNKSAESGPLLNLLWPINPGRGTTKGKRCQRGLFACTGSS